MPERDESIRWLAEEDLVFREVVEECASVGYVAVQQKGRPAFPVHTLCLLFEVRPLL